MRHALRTRGELIANELAASVLARHGQQCTKPGLIVVSGEEDARWLYSEISSRFADAPPRRMLAPWIADAFRRRINTITPGCETHTGHPAQEGADPRNSRAFAGLVLCSMVDDYEHLHEEAFGPAVIIVGVESLWNVAPWVYASLTASIYFDDADLADTEGELPNVGTEILRSFASHDGRIIFNGPPTGVRVATSTVHGGPFPATNVPHTTAVGPLAIERWCRPICFQNCPDALLPPELQNANPLGIWRTVNCEVTRSPIA